MMGLMLLILMMMFMMFLESSKILKLLMQNIMFFLSMILLLYGHYDYCWSKVSIMVMMGLDQYNYILMLFLFWLMGLTMLGISIECQKVILFLLNLLMFFVFFTFGVFNLMYFYFFFESSLLPIFLLIVVMGSNYSRLSAGMYMLMYTLIFSLPLMISLLICYYEYYTLNMIYLMYSNLEVDIIIYMMFILAFLVKMPVYGLHIWLPKAHVEAPCCGSMLLAGILLKLGSYGLLRIMVLMLNSSVKFNINFMFFCLLGALMSSFLCMRQSDLKMLVAYSSVVHMGMMLGGMMTLSLVGYLGSLYMMIGHGLCSSGLFYIVNVSYERVSSRLIYVNKGLIGVMPMMTLWWFFLCSSNMAAPISLNLLSEIYLISSLMMFDCWFMLILMMISFFSACYSIYLFCSSQHGVLFMKNNVNSGKMSEFMVLFLHWFPLNILIMNMGLIWY